MSNPDNLAASADDDTLGLWLRGLRVQSPSFTQGSENTRESTRICARFWSHVDRDNGPIHPTLGRCWIWTGSRNAKGYGCSGGWKRLRTALAHRISYVMATGAVPRPGLHVRHLCSTPPCVNPTHLAEGDAKQNAQDALDAGHYQRGEGHYAAKLTAADVASIRTRRAAGERSCDLADEYGVSRGLVTHICRGRIWRALGGPIVAPLNRGRYSAPGATP